MRVATRVLERLTGPARLNVLIFHRVVNEPDPLDPDVPTAAGFRAFVRLLKRYYLVLSLSEAIARLRSGTLPAASAVITFDDGYADNFEVARPILQEESVSATFFVATKYLDGGCMWNDVALEAVRATKWDEVELNLGGGRRLDLKGWDAKRRSAKQILEHLRYMGPEDRDAAAAGIEDSLGTTRRKDLMMSAEQVAKLYAAGFEIGGHTHGHPILARVDPAVARQEVLTGLRRLEDIVSGPVKMFAYPNGKPGVDYKSEHVAMVREAGFTAACSTASGAQTRGGDPLQIPRFTPWRYGDLGFLGLMLRNSLNTNPVRV